MHKVGQDRIKGEFQIAHGAKRGFGKRFIFKIADRDGMACGFCPTLRPFARRAAAGLPLDRNFTTSLNIVTAYIYMHTKLRTAQWSFAAIIHNTFILNVLSSLIIVIPCRGAGRGVRPNR